MYKRSAVVILIGTLFAGISGCEEHLFHGKENDPQYVFDSFWQEVDRHYSYFDRVDVNWDTVYSAYRPMVTASTTNTELFSIMDEVLTLLQDGHVNIYAPMGTGGNTQYFSAYPANPIIVEPGGSYFDYYKDEKRRFEYGKLRNTNLAYLRIKTFQGQRSDFEEIDAVLMDLHWSSALIIDVRSNLGGSISNAESIASRFSNSTQLAYEYRVRNGPDHNDFTNWQKVNLIKYSGKAWSRPVIILTNRSSFSATEWFVFLMKSQPKVTIVGDTTGGGGAVPITRELSNGWILRISNTQTRLPSGHVFQKAGIYPDVPVWIKKEDEEESIDTILERAMTI